MTIRITEKGTLVKGVLVEQALKAIYQLGEKNDSFPTEWKQFNDDVLQSTWIGNNCVLKKLSETGIE